MRIAIRRWGDKCFHLVDEEVEEGYIMDGHLIRREDVIDRKDIDWKDSGRKRAEDGKDKERDTEECSSGAIADEPGR